jgi:mersacidin/lichenicidin family type 2 lantibiotic
MRFDIIRAWKDEAYRKSLSASELAQLPENPAGAFELSDDELESLAYGAGNGDTVTQAVLCIQTVLLALCNGMNAC